jgi:hypothetical protein
MDPLCGVNEEVAASGASEGNMLVATSEPSGNADFVLP